VTPSTYSPKGTAHNMLTLLYQGPQEYPDMARVARPDLRQSHADHKAYHATQAMARQGAVRFNRETLLYEITTLGLDLLERLRAGEHVTLHDLQREAA
jgi:hypothetical protein